MYTGSMERPFVALDKRVGKNSIARNSRSNDRLLPAAGKAAKGSPKDNKGQDQVKVDGAAAKVPDPNGKSRS